MKQRPNVILKFLEGNWTCEDTLYISGKAPVINRYDETMAIKDKDTLMITAYGLKDTPITKDMIIAITDDNVTMRQGDFTATGKIRGNRVVLVNNDFQSRDYEIRLYLMADTYLYQMDTFEDGLIISAQTSYLKRKP